MVGFSPLQRRSSHVVIASASVAIALYRLIIWRARKRAKNTADRMESIAKGGPLIDVSSPAVRDQILERAISRASTWMTLSTKKAQPMIGQVGGASIHKKPLLSLAPDYVLKPVLTDHRGIREIAFYSAMETVARARPSATTYVNLLKGAQNKNTSLVHRVGELLDTLALAFAMLLKDSAVVSSEAALKAAWRTTKREADLLHTLSKFTPPYYGVVGQEAPSPYFPFGVSNDAHLLLHDLTKNFSRPCVMDLKMGTTTFEPDANPEKKEKEFSKYRQQALYGFRIVGMRIYQPSHSEADDSGYRFFGKEYGRGLETRDQVKEALKVFFGAGLEHVDTPEHQQEDEPTNGSKVNGEQQQQQQSSSSSSSDFRLKSASNIFVQLRHIQRWFEDNYSLLFCASSLLLVYEGNTCCEAPDVTTLKMIDFGRVRRNAPEGDPGYVHGLRTMRTLLEELIEEEKQRHGTAR